MDDMIRQLKQDISQKLGFEIRHQADVRYLHQSIVLENNFNIAEEMIYPDHYNYKKSDIIDIKERAKKIYRYCSRYCHHGKGTNFVLYSSRGYGCER